MSAVTKINNRMSRRQDSQIAGRLQFAGGMDRLEFNASLRSPEVLVCDGPSYHLVKAWG